MIYLFFKQRSTIHVVEGEWFFDFDALFYLCVPILTHRIHPPEAEKREFLVLWPFCCLFQLTLPSFSNVMTSWRLLMEDAPISKNQRYKLFFQTPYIESNCDLKGVDGRRVLSYICWKYWRVHWIRSSGLPWTDFIKLLILLCHCTAIAPDGTPQIFTATVRTNI